MTPDEFTLLNVQALTDPDLALAVGEIKRLQEKIAKAPHWQACNVLVTWVDVRGQHHYEVNEANCTCWKVGTL